MYKRNRPTNIHYNGLSIQISFVSKAAMLEADSGIVMVDGCFMVDGPCVNHAEKAVNHVLWLTGFLGRWLTEPCLMSNFELSGHQFGTILKSFILTFQSASI